MTSDKWQKDVKWWTVRLASIGTEGERRERSRDKERQEKKEKKEKFNEKIFWILHFTVIYISSDYTMLYNKITIMWYDIR